MAQSGRSVFRARALEQYARGRDKSVLARIPGTRVADGLSRLVSPWARRRVPVVLQREETECGAACLSMILRYHGRSERLATLRDAAGPGRDGLSARVLADVGQRFGLRARGLRVEPSDLPAVPMPAIAHWGFNHFVVLERWSSDGVDIVDPAVGRRRVQADELDANLTGVVLAMEPGAEPSAAQALDGKAGLSYLAQVARMPDLGAMFVQVLVASLLLQVLGLTVPFLTEYLVDTLLPAQADGLLGIVGVGVLVVVVVQAAVTYARGLLLLQLRCRVDSHLMLGFFEHVLSLPYRFFLQRSTGDLLSRLGSNMTVRDILTNQTLAIVLDGGLVLVALLVLLVRDPLFAAATLGIAALQVGVLLTTASRARALTQHELVAEADSQAYVVEAMRGISTLKAAGAEQRALEHWSGLFLAHLNVVARRTQLEAAIEGVLAGSRLLAALGLLWLGATRVLDGSSSLGAMLASVSLAAAFLAPLGSLVATGQRLQTVGAHLDRLVDVLEAPPEQSRGAGRTPTLRGRLQVRDLSFRYDPQAPLALDQVDLLVEPGQKVAIVGPTGSGKSTLAGILLGLHQPTSGAVLIDRVPLAELEYRALRRQFGVVLQDPFLFRGTIRQNVAFSDPSMPLDRVVEATRAAQIHDEIAAMPMAYETLLGEGGAGLSGGQRQRLALARALAQRPTLLLLDEATSALDAVTERRVDEQLSALQCTRIVIAHRLSTVRDADLILVLDGGRVVERGTHAELLALDGMYTALVGGQLASETSV